MKINESDKFKLKHVDSWWEDLNMEKDLKQIHQDVVEEMNIPEWMSLKCFHCGDKLPQRCIRSISAFFNSRNIFDVGVQVCCENCGIMETLYFRNAIKSMKEFSDVILGKCSDEFKSIVPIREEEMYKIQYNNLLEHNIKENI